MLYWWPRVEELSIPMPKTILIPCRDPRGIIKALDGGKNKTFDALRREVQRRAPEIGFPLFLRSDRVSNKHEWKKSCYVESIEQIPARIFKLLDFSLAVDVSFEGVAIRKFLDLDARFTAFWGEMPIAVERRLFVNGTRVVCEHPYWPPESIERPVLPEDEFDLHPDRPPELWEKILDEMQKIGLKELKKLKEYARRLGVAMGKGYWSFDFCRGKNGTWYFTDMAVGEESFHWPGCKKARGGQDG